MKQDQYKTVANLEQNIIYPNLDDWENDFWKHNYVIYISGLVFAVNANHENDALDYIIDYCEEHYKGLIMTEEDRQEIEDEGFIEDYICGGNHGVYLHVFAIDIHIEEIN